MTVIPLTIVYADGSTDCSVTISPDLFRVAAANGHDWLTHLEAGLGATKRIVALIPIPITPGYERIRRKESLQ